MNIRTLLIDDEEKSLNILKGKLSSLFPELEILMDIQDPEEAVYRIDILKPDLVFIDIAMPVLSGFDVLSKIKKPNFETIFVTAFDQYAIEAIKHAAIGYLLKPIDDEDLIVAVKNALSNIKLKNALTKNQSLIENLSIQDYQKRKLAIPSQNELTLAKISSIIHCEGEGGYTRFHFTDQSSMLSSHSLGYYKESLMPCGFFQTHRSHLINLQLINKYYNDGHVEMENGQKIPVSRNRRMELIEAFKMEA